ncbi:amidoligase family protein [Microvirga sp. BT689]|uniref:amidoligase family protein n=1 Tax=Microvirga arvi TaxID=2778731 RepID=UPI0019512A78|nr:amidoligase family protein [Microvirga arvi]MBM6581688.1 amidoligase family protein [Microvirga arvi]
MNDLAIATETSSAPIRTAPGGAIRRVGVEIEFMGPSARVAAGVIAGALGGSIDAEDAHAFRISGTRLGDMRIETDLRYVHPQRHPNLGLRLGHRAAAWLGAVVSPFVPRELVTAPLPIDRLPELDGLVDILRDAGAHGRGAVLLDSLGLHFNIDPPRLDAATIAAFLKAFLIVSERLRRDIAQGRRRLAHALPPDYPQDYVRQVLAPDYWPDLPDLTMDYLAANPTRDRALDLLPLLAYLDDERIRSVLPHEKIGARPAFHYRLPQVHLSDPDWSIMPDWHRWLVVEGLASDLEKLCAIGRAMSACH